MAAPKPEARARAIELRKQGWSYSQIQEATGASPGSLSLWLRDIPLTEEQRAELALRRLRGSTVGAKATRLRRQEREAELLAQGLVDVGCLTERELFLVGVALYWAEGSKAKPWSVTSRVTLINSDPAVIRVFLAWLRLLDVGGDRLRFRLSIHESADVEAASRYWAAVVGVDPGSFQRPTLKRHNPRTVRRNTGAAYRGCLVVGVSRSTDLNRRIAGWWAGIAAAARSPVGTIGAPSGVV